jgi:hypothetical protein
MSKPPLMKAAKKNRAPAPGDEVLTTEEAAKRLKRSAKTLEYWRTVGLEPPYYRQQRGVRYLLSEIMAWGASHRVDG